MLFGRGTSGGILGETSTVENQKTSISMPALADLKDREHAQNWTPRGMACSESPPYLTGAGVGLSRAIHFLIMAWAVSIAAFSASSPPMFIPTIIAEFRSGASHMNR